MRGSRLTPQTLQILEAAIARIIPDDDDEPGAQQADAFGYVRWAGAQPWFAVHESHLTLGATLLDAFARTACARPFCACRADTQDAIIGRVLALETAAARAFGSSLLNLAIAGFLCHPRYGGNCDCAGWRFIGLGGDEWDWT